MVECEACWPIALRPKHLDRWWSAQPLGQIFVVLTELEVEEKLHALTSPAIVAEVKPGPPHRDVTICLGTCGPAHDRAPEVNVDMYLPFGRSVDARFNLLAHRNMNRDHHGGRSGPNLAGGLKPIGIGRPVDFHSKPNL